VSETTADVTTPTDAAPARRRGPSYRHGDVGYAWLSVPDIDRAAAFYAAVLGWSVAAGADSQGRQVAGRSPHLGLHGGQARATVNCCYAVEDVAAAAARVRAAGGVAGEPEQAPYGLVVDCTDDQDTVFALYQPPGGVGTDPPPMGGHGDLVYVTFEVVDSARARAFYGEVLGWTFAPGSVEDGWQVEGATAGLHGGHPRATTLPMWQVDDIAAALERVRAAGGTSTDPQTRPYGLEAECADDQGTRFYLGQL
jgi:predicted enzyme related to lactoylglutathione lyase